MNFVSNIFKGIALGAGAILPGISSGVLCVIFGIYEKLLHSILNFFSDIKKNIKFLLPILIGIFLGVLVFSNFLQYFLYKFPIQTNSIFIGLILSTIPSLIKEINKKHTFKLRYTLFTFFAFLVGLFSVILEKHLSVSINTNHSFLYLIISGFAMSIGIVVPGVSSTIILMLLGVYTTYISSISYLYFPVLIPICIGLILGCLIFMKLTKFLLEHFYAPTFYSIIGFTLGSIIVLLPEINSSLELLISILCIFLGYFIWGRGWPKRNFN